MRTEHRHRLLPIAVAGASFALFLAPPAQADGGENTFSAAVSSQELAELRAGDVAVGGNENLTQYVNSGQQTSGAGQGNTVSGDSIPAGAVTLTGQAMSNVRGINNVVINSAAQAIVQGTVSLTVIANN